MHGAATPTHVSTAYTYNLAPSGYMQFDQRTTTVNGGADGSPTTLVTADAFAWNDTVSATSTSATGTYLLNVQTEKYLQQQWWWRWWRRNRYDAKRAPPTENGEAIGFGSPILSGNIVPECDPQLPLEALCIGWTRFWSNPKWLNQNKELTNGTYTILNSAQMRHVIGSAPDGKSVFAPGVDAGSLVLDAAQFADENLLWNARNRALVNMGYMIGTVNTGVETSWLTVTRRSNGYVHGWPEEAP